MRTVGLAAKTIVEWLIALAALILLLPGLLLIALVIKLTSPGPVLFIDDRLGRGGKPFRMLKFRSMVVGAPPTITDDNKVVVEQDDPRVTAVGRLLRVGFDELPQLLNVLRGEMALIGPRPDNVWAPPTYTEAIRPRLELRPGITGLAQVLRGRDLSTGDNFRLDVYYVRHWSPWLDLRIALLTPLYVVGWKDVGREWRDRVLTA